MNHGHEALNETAMVLEDCQLTASLTHDAHVPVRVETEDDSLEQLATHDQATTWSSAEESPKDKLPSNFPPEDTEWDTYPTPFTSPANGHGLTTKSKSELVEVGSSLSIEADRNIIPHIPRQGGAPTFNTDVAGSMAFLLGSWQDEDGRDLQSILKEIEEVPLSTDRRQRCASEAIDRFQEAFHVEVPAPERQKNHRHHHPNHGPYEAPPFSDVKEFKEK